MSVSEYLFTPADAVRGIRSLSVRHFLAIAAAVTVYIVGGRFVGADIALLGAGLLFMAISDATYRLPLVLAVTGLVALMAMSPFVHEGNSLESFSERVAVWVFFMLIFGVFKMLYDEVAKALFGKKHAHRTRNNGPKTILSDEEPRRERIWDLSDGETVRERVPKRSKKPRTSKAKPAHKKTTHPKRILTPRPQRARTTNNHLDLSVATKKSVTPRPAIPAGRTPAHAQKPRPRTSPKTQQRTPTARRKKPSNKLIQG